MKKYFVFLVLAPSLSFAAGLKVTDYKTVSCTLSKGEVVLQQESALKLMTLTIDDHLGRFAQMTWRDGERALQYQILLEDDVTSSALESLVVLQNLKVDDQEFSAEFSAQNVSSVQISSKDYTVRCAFPHE